jgi:hypothetical protein
VSVYFIEARWGTAWRPQMNTFWPTLREAKSYYQEVYRGDKEYRIMKYVRASR